MTSKWCIAMVKLESWCTRREAVSDSERWLVLVSIEWFLALAGRRSASHPNPPLLLNLSLIYTTSSPSLSTHPPNSSTHARLRPPLYPSLTRR